MLQCLLHLIKYFIEITPLRLACKPIFQKINTLYEKAIIEVEGKHFDLDILMGGDMKFLQLVLVLGNLPCSLQCKKHFDLLMIMSNIDNYRKGQHDKV
jgi:hypothetical protein